MSNPIKILPVDNRGNSIQSLTSYRAYEITVDDTDNITNVVGPLAGNNIRVINLSESIAIWVKLHDGSTTVGTPSDPREFEFYVSANSNINRALSNGRGGTFKYIKMKALTGTADVIIEDNI